MFLPQCRTVKITILGDEGVPIQVDGEAWVQPPGVIKIQHKNRAQMLTRDRVRQLEGGLRKRDKGGRGCGRKTWKGYEGWERGGERERGTKRGIEGEEEGRETTEKTILA